MTAGRECVKVLEGQTSEQPYRQPAKLKKEYKVDVSKYTITIYFHERAPMVIERFGEYIFVLDNVQPHTNNSGIANRFLNEVRNNGWVSTDWTSRGESASIRAVPYHEIKEVEIKKEPHIITVYPDDSDDPQIL